MVFRRVFTKFGHKYASSYEVYISPDQMASNMSLNIIKDLTDNVWLKLGVSQREAKNVYRSMFAYDVNLCSFSYFGKPVNLIQRWMHNILKYSNIPDSCPIKKGNYYWINLRADKDSIPSFITTGHFRIDALFYMREWNNDMVTNTSMFLDIKMK
ncbi:GH14811 [Drosophila grimshawi]|uniref:GH14811 n=2 Tax=Drosophila grimshawi TaxID=7222 RepID=B4J394_DROGR|nr:GH14811 [Drosophila grimshawi]